MANIKIIMRRNAASPQTVYQEGHEYTMDEAIASDWVVNRYAVASDPAKQAQILHDHQQMNTLDWSVPESEIEEEVITVKKGSKIVRTLSDKSK